MGLAVWLYTSGKASAAGNVAVSAGANVAASIGLPWKMRAPIADTVCADEQAQGRAVV